MREREKKTVTLAHMTFLEHYSSFYLSVVGAVVVADFFRMPRAKHKMNGFFMSRMSESDYEILTAQFIERHRHCHCRCLRLTLLLRRCCLPYQCRAHACCCRHRCRRCWFFCFRFHFTPETPTN